MMNHHPQALSRSQLQSWLQLWWVTSGKQTRVTLRKRRRLTRFWLFFIETNRQSPLRLGTVQPYDITQSIDEHRIPLELERLEAMRRWEKSGPYAVNRCTAETGMFGHGARLPARGVDLDRLQE
jgi:hypothetical protein